MPAEELSSVRGGLITVIGLPTDETLGITDGVFRFEIVEGKLKFEAFKPGAFPDVTVKTTKGPVQR